MLDKFAEDADDNDLLLRIEIIGRGPKGFQYDLQLVNKSEGKKDDISLEIDGMAVLVDLKSKIYLEGTTIDYKETLMGGGFSFDNPNPLWMDELSQAVAEIISD